MDMVNQCFKRRLVFYFANVMLCLILLLAYIKKPLIPLFREYGEYQITNLIMSVMNICVEENINDFVLKEAIYQNEYDKNIFEFNLDIINSVACNIVNRAHQILKSFEYGYVEDEVLTKINLKNDLYEFENGVVYKIPVSEIFDNFLVSNLGFKIPIKYKFVGSIKGDVVSSVDEYGINNALIKISLNIVADAKIILPVSTANNSISLQIPMIIRAINGEIPSYYLGTNIVGGVNK